MTTSPPNKKNALPPERGLIWTFKCKVNPLDQVRKFCNYICKANLNFVPHWLAGKHKRCKSSTNTSSPWAHWGPKCALSCNTQLTKPRVILVQIPLTGFYYQVLGCSASEGGLWGLRRQHIQNDIQNYLGQKLIKIMWFHAEIASKCCYKANIFFLICFNHWSRSKHCNYSHTSTQGRGSRCCFRDILCLQGSAQPDSRRHSQPLQMRFAQNMPQSCLAGKGAVLCD